MLSRTGCVCVAGVGFGGMNPSSPTKEQGAWALGTSRPGFQPDHITLYLKGTKHFKKASIFSEAQCCHMGAVASASQGILNIRKILSRLWEAPAPTHHVQGPRASLVPLSSPVALPSLYPLWFPNRSCCLWPPEACLALVSQKVKKFSGSHCSHF